MTRKLMKGNEAVVYGALLGGGTHFFGYPITPASEIAHTAADLFTRSGRVFLQAESEVSVINMVYGASAAGARVITASSGPGISLMAEGISYLAGSEIPAVIVNIQRAGPGLGNIWPEQGDYAMCVKGGGHGNYRNFVFAPNSCQEMCEFTYRAFDLADQWRMTVFILSDAYIGQMMEPVQLPTEVKTTPFKDWAVRGDAESRENCITSIFMSAQTQGALNQKLQDKYRTLEESFSEYEEVEAKDADTLIVAFGITSRICLSAVRQLRSEGVKVGLFRPKTLFPFPIKRLQELAEAAGTVIVAELNNGQMAEDVERLCAGTTEVRRLNWFGGMVPTPGEIVERVRSREYAGT